MKDRIKLLRSTLGVTQAKFAEAIGVKQNTVAQYEAGRNPPTDTVITLICRKYNINEEWLRNGTGEMFKPVSAAEQVNRLMNEVIRTDGSESWQAARKTIIEALAEMPPEFWEQAAKLIEEIKNR